MFTTALVAMTACDSGSAPSKESAPAVAKVADDPGDAELARRIELHVAEGLLARYGEQAVSVECPARVHVSKGNTFVCTAHLSAGAALPVDVRITGEDGSFEAREKPVVLLDRLTEVIGARYRARGSRREVDCGGSIRASEPGSSFDCRAGDLTVGVTVTSWQGRVELAYPPDGE